MAALQGESNLREGSVTSPDRYDRIGGLDNKGVPCMTESRADDDIKVLVTITGIRYDPNGQPSLFPGTLACGFHDTGEPATQKRFVISGNQAADSPGGVVFFQRRISRADYCDLSHNFSFDSPPISGSSSAAGSYA